jgi:hypothetical protein
MSEDILLVLRIMIRRYGIESVNEVIKQSEKDEKYERLVVIKKHLESLKQKS